MNQRIKFIFTTSILLNILMMGLAGGVIYQCSAWNNAGFLSNPAPPMPSDMTAQGQEALKQSFMKGRAEMKTLFEEMRDQRQIVEGVVTADPFDRAAYDKEAARLLDLREKISRARSSVVADTLETLSAEDRQKFATHVLDGLEGHGSRWKKGGKTRERRALGEKNPDARPLVPPIAPMDTMRP